MYATHRLIMMYLCAKLFKNRCNQPWYLNGKHKECEKYQISLIEEITGVKVDKTNKRINLITNKLVDVKKKINILEWTENLVIN